MIIAKDDSWAICTPPKTGTVSLQSCLVPHYGIKTKNRHETEYTGKGKRILIIRHPLERWASMYWFTFQKRKRGIFLRHFADDPNKYALEWLKRVENKPWPYFTDTLTMYMEKFQADYVWKLEDGFEKPLKKLLKIEVEVPHNNITHKKCSWAETSKLIRKPTVDKIKNYLKKDMQIFNYE